jgi:hypothetical protein
VSATETDDPQVGQSIEEIAAAEEPGQLPIPGTRETLSLSAGGEKPQSSSIKLRGGSLSLEGQFDKGETVAIWVEVRIAEVQFVDKTDAHGNINGTERRHVGRMQRVQRQ